VRAAGLRLLPLSFWLPLVTTVVFPSVHAAPAVAPAPVAESKAARADARTCLETDGDTAVAACHSALARGLAPEREALVLRAIALNLAAQQRWDEALEAYRQEAARRPGDADVERRVGLLLLLALGRAAEAEAPLREAVRLQPNDAEAWVGLALALGAQGRTAEAAAAFEEARSHDSAILADRPAAAALFEAARHGEAWP
jgi:tetratricopeptide (TPR) repeat protein